MQVPYLVLASHGRGICLVRQVHISSPSAGRSLILANSTSRNPLTSLISPTSSGRKHEMEIWSIGGGSYATFLQPCPHDAMIDPDGRGRIPVTSDSGCDLVCYWQPPNVHPYHSSKDSPNLREKLLISSWCSDTPCLFWKEHLGGLLRFDGAGVRHLTGVASVR